jgi:hypothetical protein
MFAKKREPSEKKPTANIRSDEEWRVEQRKNWRRQLWLQWILAATAVVASIVGIFTLIILKRTLEITTDQLHRSQRPWIGITDLIITDPLTFDNNGARITVRANLKNYGNSPANTTYPVADIVIGKDQQAAKALQQSLCSFSILDVMNKAEVGNTLFPNQEVQTPLLPQTIRWEDMKGGKTAKTNMSLVGCVMYLDQFGKSHRTNFFYFFVPFQFLPEGVVEGIFRLNFMGNHAD